MSWYNKVVWSEGLFLRPQLFQQQERYLEHFAHKRAAALSPFFWGFHHLAIDAEALALGKLVVSGAAGIFQDGTPFDAPAHAKLPAPLALRHEHLNQIIYLAVPIRTPNAEETSFEDAQDSLARYRSFEEDLLDANSIGQGPKLVQLGDLRLRLMPEKELTESWLGMPLAKVTEIRADGSARLDAGLIPPANVYTASALLQTWLAEVHGLLRLRATSMAERLTASSTRGGDAAEISEYLILQLFNRAEPVLEHMLAAKADSPEALYVQLTALAGELSTFVRTATRRPNPDYPAYRHDEPHTCIKPVVDDLRFLLNVVLERGAQRIELRDQQHGIRLAVLDPAEFERFNTFVLAVGAQLPSDVLQQQFPAQAKVGPAERLAELIRSHLPGIPLQAMPVPPRQIPFNAGQVYFELPQDHPLWAQVQRYGGLALHVAGNFPELRLELWGVR
ncbi:MULTISPECIES: type VI secretion system baseplate subunit TssK [Ralstonia]|jgi:type VI secretion system protein ImpJ|uniref:Type VI secretion system baseplate subunit TssK n=2 Tax=Ralstonia pickettii TaxID=329 RepID=A0ABM9IM86_RALPI|nr:MULTISPECIES: type VI secretion system baseplate subunit TssK [Ralstonia]MBA4199116.1 type VI secretion system baseplate subunit TssK [Ralstonia sp.]MBA4230161.1 type VI secretion system baseplate subunit TssK [Ralstonia sp.]MBA4234984.1 type VI secretion system baseplate subunit TssK [Ralstonia sp.]MBA4277961.1 type VI secretion system baseplate subunit TssK [Ralstonia sp.]MBA4400405.1 type VI secretion system baseplate subunit TssK [Ralstonia sp.]